MGITADLRKRKQRDRTNAYRATCKLVDARDGSLCRVCALPLRQGAHHHHIINRSLGGKDTTENLVLVCPSCHVLIHQKRVLVSGSGDGHLAVLWKGRDTL